MTMLIGLFIVSCESDLCDNGYTQLDNGVCVPDYVVGIEKNTQLGNVFFHAEHGAITLKNGKWHDHKNIIIENIND